MQGLHLTLARNLAPLASSDRVFPFHRLSRLLQEFLCVHLRFRHPLWSALVGAAPLANAAHFANLCFLSGWCFYLARHSCSSLVACLQRAALNHLDSNHCFERVCRIRSYRLILLLVLWLARNGGQIYSIVPACEFFGETRCARVQTARSKVD